MRTFLVERHRQPILEFEGELLADLSSEDTSDGRVWQEVRIYRALSTDGSIKYVTEMLRNTNDPEVAVLRNVNIYDRPEDVRKGLFRDYEGRRFLTNLARDALDIAAEQVPEIATIDPDLNTERI